MVEVFEVNAFERATQRRRRPQFTVEPLTVTWDAIAFKVRGSRDAIACVPRRSLDDFLDALEAGTLDAEIKAFLDAPPAGRVLRSAGQSRRPALFDELSSPASLAPNERVPGRTTAFGHGGGSPVDARRNKGRRGPRPRRLLVGAAVGTIVVAAAVVAALAASGGDSKPTVSANAPTTSTTTTSTTTTTTPATTAVTALSDVTILNGTYAVTQVYAGCGEFDGTQSGEIPVSIDEATKIVTIGVSEASGPIDGTKFSAPTTYTFPGGGSSTVPLAGFFDVSGPVPVLHAQADPPSGGTNCHITYDGPRG